MPRLSTVVLTALLGACLALPAAAQWKWRTKDGQIQYSDLPPPGSTAEQDILQRPHANQRRIGIAQGAASAASAASAGSGAAVTAARVDPELEARRRKAEQETADKEKAEQTRIAAIKAENCGKAKSYLRTLDDGIRISRTDAKGEREVLDDAARAEEAKKMREVIARDCGK